MRTLSNCVPCLNCPEYLKCTVNILSTIEGVDYCIRQNFRWTKFRQAQLLCIAEIFGEINFRQCSKGRHILNVIINTGQKIRTIKILPIRADGEIGEIFLLAKISAYTVRPDW